MSRQSPGSRVTGVNDSTSLVQFLSWRKHAFSVRPVVKDSAYLANLSVFALQISVVWTMFTLENGNALLVQVPRSPANAWFIFIMCAVTHFSLLLDATIFCYQLFGQSNAPIGDRIASAFCLGDKHDGPFDIYTEGWYCLCVKIWC